MLAYLIDLRRQTHYRKTLAILSNSVVGINNRFIVLILGYSSLKRALRVEGEKMLQAWRETAFGLNYLVLALHTGACLGVIIYKS